MVKLVLKIVYDSKGTIIYDSNINIITLALVILWKHILFNIGIYLSIFFNNNFYINIYLKY